MKRALLAFVIALVAYAVLYRVIEHRRASNGPWQVTFTKAETGAPAILINQPAIRITNVQILFSAGSDVFTNTVNPRHPEPASAGPITVTFNEARKTPFDVPHGKCVFLDTVFLPGTVALEAFGHQIQMMPRILTLDGVEHPWRSGEALTLTAKTNSSESPK